jgi:large subunit ribosomal protein L27
LSIFVFEGEILTDRIGELVVPGNIIYRQRGTKWFPGENCDMGRDHTIFAMQKGYVRYYDDASTGPKKRRYIGVVFEKTDVLPYPPNAPRRRRLGMVAYSRQNGDAEGETISDANLRLWERKDNTAIQGVNKDGRLLSMRSDYSFREYGWEIGKVMDEAEKKIRPFDHKDRWVAWRKRQTGWKRKTEERRLAASSKKGGNQKAKRKGSAKPRARA